MRNFYELDNLWNLNGGKFVLSNTDWYEMTIYEREAYKMTATDFIQESEKQLRQQKAEMTQKMEEAKEYKSQFSGITMPRFQN